LLCNRKLRTRAGPRCSELASFLLEATGGFQPPIRVLQFRVRRSRASTGVRTVFKNSAKRASSSTIVRRWPSAWLSKWLSKQAVGPFSGAWLGALYCHSQRKTVRASTRPKSLFLARRPMRSGLPDVTASTSRARRAERKRRRASFMVALFYHFLAVVSSLASPRGSE